MTRLEELLGAELVAAIRVEIRAELEAASAAPDRLHSVDEAAEALSVGRTTIYAEMAAGRLRSVHVGRRRLVPSSAISEYARRVMA